MPCNDGGSGRDVWEAVQPVQERLDMVTRLLCGSLRHLKKTDKNAYNSVLGNSAELNEWWVDHQRVDREREKEERRSARINHERLTRELAAGKAKLAKLEKHMLEIGANKLKKRIKK